MNYVCTKVKGVLIWRPKENAKEIAKSPSLKYLNAELEKFRTKIQKTDVSNLYEIQNEGVSERYLWTQESINSIPTALNLIIALGVVPEKKINFVNFWNQEWARPLLPDWCFIGSGGGACGSQDVYANLKWFADSGNHQNTNPNLYEDETQKFLISANVPHEIGHIAQIVLRERSGDRDSFKSDQAWYREGGAEFTKVIWYALTNNVSYSFARNLYVKNLNQYCKTISLGQLTTNGSSESGCEYNVGFLGVEYLMWKVKDIKAFYKIYPNLNSTKSFDETFELTYGIKFNRFIEEVDKYVKEQTR